MPTDYLFYSDDDFTANRNGSFGEEGYCGCAIPEGQFLAISGPPVVEDGKARDDHPTHRAHRDPARRGWWIVRSGTTSIVVDGAEIDLTAGCVAVDAPFKVGDRVRLTTSAYVAYGNGPLTFGEDGAVVAPVYGDGCNVRWEDGHERHYRFDAGGIEHIQRPATVQPAPPQPEQPSDAAVAKGPTDREIATAFGLHQRECVGILTVGEGRHARQMPSFRVDQPRFMKPPEAFLIRDAAGREHRVPMDDVRAAWSRELARLTAEARERDRLSVLVDIDAWEHS